MPAREKWACETSPLLQLGPDTPAVAAAHQGKPAVEIARTLLTDILQNSTLPQLEPSTPPEHKPSKLLQRLKAYEPCLHLKKVCATHFLHVKTYPVIKVDSRSDIQTCRLHRLMLCLKDGNPPPGSPAALHGARCGNNKTCFNPSHLRWGGATENSQDWRKNRRSKTRSHTDSSSLHRGAQARGYTARPSRLCSRLCMVMGLGNMVTAVI